MSDSEHRDPIALSLSKGALRASRLRHRLRQAQPERVWERVPTKKSVTLLGLFLFVLAFAAIDYATLPPPLPDYARTRAAWHPSEAWLYDRHGRLIDSARVDFAARRLGWTPLDTVSPVARETIVAAEDRRFFAALRASGARIRHAPEIEVVVSGRLVGRAEGGMADTIHRRMRRADPYLDDALEPVRDFWRRIRGEAMGVRRLVPAASAAAELAAARRILRWLGQPVAPAILANT